MSVSVVDACIKLDSRGLLDRRKRNDFERIVPYVQGLLGGRISRDLVDFYREGIYAVGEFLAVVPVWNDRVGWRTPDSLVTELLHVQAVPVMGDGCGNLFGLDLASKGREAVYFFDHEDGFARPEWAAGSSLGKFLLLMADYDRAYEEGWPADWWLSIDPNIDKCPRARPLWLAD